MSDEEGYNFTSRKVTKEEYDEFMKNNKIITVHTVRFAEPPVKFYWTANHGDHSFGRYSVARRVLNSLSPYYENAEDDLYLHDYPTKGESSDG